METRWLIAAIGCAALTTFANEEQTESDTSSAHQDYQACIDAETEKQTSKNNGKITDADAIIDACSAEKEALTDELDAEVAEQLISQLERHLRDRESNGG